MDNFQMVIKLPVFPKRLITNFAHMWLDFFMDTSDVSEKAPTLAKMFLANITLKLLNLFMNVPYVNV